MLREPATADALVAFCRERPGDRAPRIVYLFSSLPKTATGKMLKRELAQRLSQLLSPSGRAL